MSTHTSIGPNATDTAARAIVAKLSTVIASVVPPTVHVVRRSPRLCEISHTQGERKRGRWRSAPWASLAEAKRTVAEQDRGVDAATLRIGLGIVDAAPTCHMVALYTVWYNFMKQHKSLKGLSPAMAAGVSETLW